MSEIIRKIREEDFPQVSNLYDFRKGVTELKWLYSDIEDPSIYNAYVAVRDEKEIIGVIGFSISNYSNGAQSFYGIIPMTWKLKDDYKGMAGVLLFKKLLSLTDVGITIGGSQNAKNLYPLFKFKNVSQIDIYYKVLNIFKTYQSFHYKKPIKKIALTLYMFFKNLPGLFYKTNFNEIYMEPYDGSNYIDQNPKSNILAKKISKKYIDWLLACPILESFSFHIYKNEVFLGTCVLFVQELEKYNKGRIVHLPYLGDDPDTWRKVISKLSQFFYDKNCCFVTGFAHNPSNRLVYKKSGYIKVPGHNKPLYIKNQHKSLDPIDINNWFLQYSESDKAYRDF